MNRNRRQYGAAGEAPARGLERRSLLRGLASGGGVLALVGLAGEAPAAESQSATDADDDPKRLGFRVTDHVRWYYRRARL